MAFLRQETLFRRESLIAGETVDIETYDRLGKYGLENKAVLVTASELPQFIFIQGGAIDDAVSVAFLGQGQVQLALAGSGNRGDRLTSDSTGRIVAGSQTMLASEAIGIALQDWTDTDLTECDILRTEKEAGS